MFHSRGKGKLYIGQKIRIKHRNGSQRAGGKKKQEVKVIKCPKYKCCTVTFISKRACDMIWNKYDMNIECAYFISFCPVFSIIYFWTPLHVTQETVSTKFLATNKKWPHDSQSPHDLHSAVKPTRFGGTVFLPLKCFRTLVYCISCGSMYGL